MLGLPHPPPVPGLHRPLVAPVTAATAATPADPAWGPAAQPPGRAALPSRRCWRHSARIARPDTSSMLPARPGGSIGVDDPQIHPRYPARIGRLALR